MQRLYIESFAEDKIGPNDEGYINYLPDEELKTCDYVYAHGELERLAGYDIVNYASKDGFDRKTNRIEDVIAVLWDGTEIQAKLFYWTDSKKHPDNHGLVVSVNDKESLEYAETCYRNKCKYI